MQLLPDVELNPQQETGLSIASEPSLSGRSLLVSYRFFFPTIGKGINTVTYGKKAIGDPWQLWQTRSVGSNFNALNFHWYYDWMFRYVPHRAMDGQHVNMVWCLSPTNTDKENAVVTIQQAAAADFVLNIRGRVWLVLNEPDDINGQCGKELINGNLRVRDDAPSTADYYVTVYDAIKAADPNAKVFVGGVTWLSSTGTRDWWRKFVKRVKEKSGASLKMDGVHVHLYPGIADVTSWPTTATGRVLILCTTQGCVTQLSNGAIAAANQWYNDMHVGEGLGNLPIWITETGYLNCSNTAATQNLNQVHTEVMKPLQDWFKSPGNPGYDAISWFATYRHDANPTSTDPNVCKYSRTDLLTQPGETGAATLLGTKWNEWQP